MDFNFKCQRCGSRNHTEAELIGTTIRCSYCSVDLEVPLTAFSSGMVQGDYWFHHKVGTGSISEVYVTKLMSTVHGDDENESTGKLYIKVISPLATVDEKATHRFFQSILQSQLVDHPNVVSVVETGIMKNHYYAATPYIDGECVDAIIERDGPLTEIDALRICLRVAKLMRDVWNEHRLVHQAIKPANILLNDEGEVFILDLCNSKQCLVPENGRIESINPHGNLFDYMNPDQIQNRPDLNPTSDIYSLGATLHCMIAGEKPYTDTMTSSIAQKHLWSPPPQLESYGKEVSPQTADLVRWMMSGSASGEYLSWEELIKRIQEIYRPKRKADGASTGSHPKIKPMHVSRKHKAPAPPDPKPDTQPIRVFKKRKRSSVSTDSQSIELVPQKKSNGLLIAALMAGIFLLGLLVAVTIWLASRGTSEPPSLSHTISGKRKTPSTPPKTNSASQETPSTPPKTNSTPQETPSTPPKTNTTPPNTKNTQPYYNRNLLVNGSAEDTPIDAAWTISGENWYQGQSRQFATDGKFYFHSGRSSKASMYQDIDVSAYADGISEGTQKFQFTGYLFGGQKDVAKVVIDCCNSKGKVISKSETGTTDSSAMEKKEIEFSVPRRTSSLRVTLISIRKTERLGQTAFDDLRLIAFPPDRTSKDNEVKPAEVPQNGSSSRNLIVNGSADIEPFLTGWEQELGIWKGGGGRRNKAIEGKRFFERPDTGHGKLYQDINVAAYKDAISKGTQEFQFTGYIRGNSAFKCVIECRNTSGNILSTTEVTSSPSEKWEETKERISAPPETAIIRVNLIVKLEKIMRGGFDDLSLVALPPNK